MTESPAAAPRRLTSTEVEDALDSIERDGYAVIRQIVDPQALEAFRVDLLENFDRMQREDGLFEGGGTITGHLNCFPGTRSRFIHDQLVDAGVFEIAARRLPGTELFPRPTLNMNLPGSVIQHWHADGLFTEAYLICNVAVCDTDLTNGAIGIIPGTHRSFLPFWRYAFGRVWRRGRRVPLEQGDAILRMSTMWHRGTPNRSDAPRPMMSMTFGDLDESSPDPWLTNDGEIEFYPNWYGTSRVGRLRERTFRTVPISYSAVRFVRSLKGRRGYDSF